MGELRIIARHAGTVWIGQLATIAFGVTDTLIAGRYQTGALAALSVGSALFISVFVALSGAVQALLPIWAQLRGAGQTTALGRSVRQALYLVAAACAVGLPLLLLPAPLLDAAGVPPGLRAPVTDYLAILALGLPPALLFRGYGTLNQALGRPVLLTWLQLGSLAVKVPLSAWLTFGGAGLPALGLTGCAWATVAVQWLLLGAAALMLARQPLYRPYALWQRPEAPDWRALRAFLRLGVPTALAVLVEVTSFTLMSLFIARLGVTASAAHQIAANLTAVLYMLPLSLGIATSARVSGWLGAGDDRRARQALRLGFLLALGLSGAGSLVLLLAHESIARLYAGDHPDVVAVASGLLQFVAAYHVADALQAVGVFVLRSYGVATRPLVLYCVLLWGVGLGGGYLLAYGGLGPVPALRSPAAFWAAGAVALALTAAAFMLLLWRTVAGRRPSS